jgi:hypothetical protein
VATVVTRLERRSDSQPSTIHLTPTGLLMEGVSTSLRSLFALLVRPYRKRKQATHVSESAGRAASPSIEGARDPWPPIIRNLDPEQGFRCEVEAAKT